MGFVLKSFLVMVLNQLLIAILIVLHAGKVCPIIPYFCCIFKLSCEYASSDFVLSLCKLVICLPQYQHLQPFLVLVLLRLLFFFLFNFT